jgi:hypothetical protein
VESKEKWNYIFVMEEEEYSGQESNINDRMPIMLQDQ